jgi:TetR/AcrR family transcriptional repressor of nem operon
MSIGRPLEFDPEQALDSALAVFWSQGYEATSLQNLLDAMALSKSSFYQAFHSKRALFERCLDRYRDQVASDFGARLNGAASGRVFIEDVLLGIADEARSRRKPRGCLVMNTANEFSQRDARLAKRVAAGVERFKGVFLAAVQRAQQEGGISREHEPDALADYLVTSITGLRTLVKAGADAATVEGVVSVILKALR